MSFDTNPPIEIELGKKGDPVALKGKTKAKYFKNQMDYVKRCLGNG